jgi:hypothetical protein
LQPLVFLIAKWRNFAPEKRKEKKRKTLLKLLSLNLLFNYGNLEFFLSRRGESWDGLLHKRPSFYSFLWCAKIFSSGISLCAFWFSVLTRNPDVLLLAVLRSERFTLCSRECLT